LLGFYADLKCIEKGICGCKKIFSKYLLFIEEICFYLVTTFLSITFYEAFVTFFFTVQNHLQILYFSIQTFTFLQIKCLLCVFKSFYAKIAKNVLYVEKKIYQKWREIVFVPLNFCQLIFSKKHHGLHALLCKLTDSLFKYKYNTLAVLLAFLLNFID
jgi:hypothetical protein